MLGELGVKPMTIPEHIREEAGPTAWRWSFTQDPPHWHYDENRPGVFFGGEPELVEPLYDTAALSDAYEAGKAEEREAAGNAGYLYGDQAPTENEKTVLQRSAGIPHLPTNLTYECRLALIGEWPRAYAWSDKPHRIVFDLCRVIEEAAAIRKAKEG